MNLIEHNKEAWAERALIDIAKRFTQTVNLLLDVAVGRYQSHPSPGNLSRDIWSR